MSKLLYQQAAPKELKSAATQEQIIKPSARRPIATRELSPLQKDRKITKKYIRPNFLLRLL